MAIPVLVFGKSGSGKSRAMKFFAEDEILLVNVEGKTPPFKKKFKYVLMPPYSDSVDRILEKLKAMPCKSAVIDDAGYLMTHYFMANHRNKQGNASFEMYDSIADSYYKLISEIKKSVPEDVIVYIIMHEDVSENTGEVKLKTIGKLLDSKVCIEGMVTICLRCMSENGKHFFRTVTDGTDPVKTPEEMFDSDEIDNNLKLVDDTIRDFYGLAKFKPNKKSNKQEEKVNE